MEPIKPEHDKYDDSDFTIDLSHAGSVVPEAPAEPAPAPAAARGPMDMREIHEAIARVEAEAKANVAAESRAHAEARARSLAEEVLFRGLGFVLLVKIVRGPWALLALPQALLFGLVHWLGFGGFGGGTTALFVGVVIAFGGFIFAWLDHLDGNTLWCGLALHVSMNLAWNVFSLDDAMALGWQATSLRIGTVLLAAAVLGLHARRRRAVTLS